MPVIPVNPNYHAASAVRKWTPSAAIRESPPRAAKTRANKALLHGDGASASTPRCHDVASIAAASVATDAGNVAGLADAHAVSAAALAASGGSIASPARSVNSSNSSDSGNSDMIGRDCAACECQSTGLTDFTNSPPPGEHYFAADGDSVDYDMPTGSK